MLPRLAVALGVLIAAYPVAPKAETVARAFESHYHAVRTLQAVFLERYSDGRSGLRVESGTVYFSRPGRMRWEYESPETKLFLIDGKHVWFYVPADHTASRADLKKSEDWRTPLALLVGKARLTQFCGSISLIDASDDSSEPPPKDHTHSPFNLLLRCSPKGKSEAASFREILFEIDPEFRLLRILIREPGDIETEFRFGDWQENVSIPETKFHFEPPIGVAIVDQDQLLGSHP